MISILKPEAKKVYFISHPTLIHVKEGRGSIEVDFKNYSDWQDKLIFLEKGQYIRFMSPSFIAQKLIFEDSALLDNEEGRVLFKHLISLGFVNFQDRSDGEENILNFLYRSPSEIIDRSILEWYNQNPFKASRSEYKAIFDVKEIIDCQFRSQPTTGAIIETVTKNRTYIHQLFQKKIGMSVKKLLMKKQFEEAKKEVAFTEKAIHHIAYDLGFRDPSYFNRAFKQREGITPSQFRESIEYSIEDEFENELFQLIRRYHIQHRTNAFYAQKLYMSEKSLGRRVRERLGTSLGSLIRNEVIQSAKEYLRQGVKVCDVAFDLGFAEPNHFSAFFKRYTKITPTMFREKSTMK